MALTFGTVTSPLDLSSQGKRCGLFALSHSNNRFAFSRIQAPLGVICGGEGSTALICAGNHGDEYEGQVIVRRLYEELDASDLSGRLILAPALNMPAVLDANRVSPLDGGNLNRSFPGIAHAGPTSEIAGFISTQLMPMADIAIDLHSGGRATNYLDCAYFCFSENPARNRETRTMAASMGLGTTLVVPMGDTDGDFDMSAHAAGCAMLSCELGGEGRISRRALDAGWQGVLRLLVHQGVVRAEAAARFDLPPAGKSNYLDLGANATFLTAQSHGLVSFSVGMGEEVRAGQALGVQRDLYRLDARPEVLRAVSDGIVAIRRAEPIVSPGDHLLVICPSMSEAELDKLIAEAER